MGVASRTDHMPTCSWWLDAANFYVNAHAEQSRMRLSWYGQMDTPTYAPDAPPPDKRTRRKATEESE